MRTPLYVLAATVAFPCGAASADGLQIKFRDGNPLDMLHVVNFGCPTIPAVLRFDFTSSAGQVVIDTAYGGDGTQDPAEIKVIAGPAVLAPVQDGDQIVSLTLDALPTEAGVVVMFDSDDSASPDHGNRVHVSGAEVAGATATLITTHSTTTASFDINGELILIPPPDAAPCLSS